MPADAAKVVATSIPLLTSFRFAHEPILVGRGGRGFIGRAIELDILAERLLFSDGGSFLITGYRGVGKTSFVNRVIDRMQELLAWASADLGDVKLMPVQLTLARAVKPVELMYLVIRRLHEELAECGLLAEVPRELREEIVLASRRTSMMMTRKLAESLEKNYGVSEASVGGTLLGALAKMTFTRKESSSRADEFVFLAYDEKSAEHDLLRIARRLSHGYRIEETWRRRVRRFFTREPQPIRKLKFVFVFDEIDKLDDIDNATPDAPPTRYLDEMLASLKNMLTTSGISFLFVAGKDLHDRWLVDLGRGDSVYESVFCYDKYLSCMWEDVAEIATRHVERQNLGSLQTQTLADFEEFLRYKGRGIPRRIIRTFNEYVRWVGQRPLLQFSRSDARRFRFYADLQKVLAGKDESLFGSLSDEASTERDRQRLGAYYFIDWVLANGVHPFTVEEGVAASRDLSRKIAPAKEVAPDVIRHLVDLLVEDEILERVQTLAAHTMIVNPHRQSAARYRLTRRRLAELGHVVEDADARVVQPDGELAPDGLKIMNLIASGGMGSVFRAWDEREGRVVAVKMVDATRFGNEPELLERFRAEAKILRSLRHRNVVRFLRVIDQKTRVYIVMEYVDGSTLREVLRASQGLPVPLACWVAGIIADALQYIHSNNIVRVDLKPENVLIQNDGTIYLSDFGISKSITARGQTLTGVIIGTPAYMAPEQFEGKVTSASDVYSFGVVLFEMLTGRRPYKEERDGGMVELARAIVAGKKMRASELAEIPPELDALIDACLGPTAEERPSLGAIQELLAFFSAEVSQRDLEEFISHAEANVARAGSQEDRSTAVGAEAPSLEFATGASFLPAARASGWNANEIVTRPNEQQNVATAPRGAHMFLIVMRPASLQGQSFALLPGKARVGRSAGTDISLDDDSVSRFHADLELIDDAVFVTDLNSANGVFVGNERIRERTPVPPGTVIRFGSVEARLDPLLT